MSELNNTYKLIIEDLNLQNKLLIEKNIIAYKKNKNQKRTILRFKKIISNLRNINEEISDNWDCIDNEESKEEFKEESIEQIYL